VTRIQHLAVVVTELLPRCGFAPVRRILARRTINGADLRNAEVFVIADRGDAVLAVRDDAELSEMAGSLEPMEFAEQAYPAAKRRLHVFADSHRPGWVTLAPGNTWIEIPTLT
jgi:hypothetical protein